MRLPRKFDDFIALLLLATAAGSFHLLTARMTVSPNTLQWRGRNWNVTTGGMAGVAKGDPANVSVDGNGYLHLRIVNRDGSYTAAELFTADNLGFGTYQWQIEGAVDKFDPTTVLGLFNYGPKAGIGVDAENEIDIEFSQWNNTCHGCNADFTFYPSTGNKSLGPREDNFTFTPNASTLTTARFEWSSTKIVATIISGLQPIGTTANVLQTLTFAPPDYAARIPQVPLPVGMNFWCFKSSPAGNQEIILRNFQFVPLPKHTFPTASRE
jgi:hypothetical protein